MIHPKLEKLLFGIFDDAIQGVDTYNHNGSMWLIFTNEMRWIVEYTKSQTLWYNYYFFEKKMLLCNLDCVDNKDLIQKWFESRFLNKNEVKETDKSNSNYRLCVENTIQNGVKDTFEFRFYGSRTVENTIQNGVKETILGSLQRKHDVEGTIQNGVKKIRWNGELGTHLCEDVIENGENYLNNKSIDL